MMQAIRKFKRRLKRDQRGIAAVEFAFAAPVFILMIYAVIEFGRAVYTEGALAFATEEATRYATVNYNATVDELKTVASSKVYGIHKDQITGINVDESVNAADQTKLVTVTISYYHNFLLPLFSVDGVTLTGASKGFLVEQ